jgi:hypothetical protein
MQTVRQHMRLRLIPGDQLAVHPDEFRLLQHHIPLRIPDAPGCDTDLLQCGQIAGQSHTAGKTP